jgi:hypothetical protein
MRKNPLIRRISPLIITAVKGLIQRPVAQASLGTQASLVVTPAGADRLVNAENV